MPPIRCANASLRISERGDLTIFVCMGLDVRVSDQVRDKPVCLAIVYTAAKVKHHPSSFISDGLPV